MMGNKITNKKALVIIAILSIALTAQSCAFGSERGTGPMGVWGSENSGATWVKLNEVVQKKGRTKNILDEVIVRDIILSPQDSLVLYAITSAGVYGSDDGGNTWASILPLNIVDLKISPSQPDILYAVGVEERRGVVYKSLNKGVDWERKFIDANRNSAQTVAIDPNDSSDIFVGFSSGLILNSTDGGLNWKPVNNLTAGLVQMDFFPGNSNVFYALIRNRGLFVTRDRGNNFVQLSRGLIPEFQGFVHLNTEDDATFQSSNEIGQQPQDYIQFTFSPVNPRLMYLTTDTGLFASSDGGAFWREIRLPIDARHAQTMAVETTSDPSIFYVSIDSVLFRTMDGGNTFATLKIPPERLINVIKTVPGMPHIVYIGLSS